ncbi:hypothetical protein CTI12_AA519720 [Artemisia annua]|uniref:Ulp1 protease family, C-terminal catalytic domain-containing protein n=1 Tax=Artemisia annua TaxID=35608 RepID=A0A2U1L851_ARTAN|nr:hypothetical protein CTI12_AA519720 [Artemisia annua]
MDVVFGSGNLDKLSNIDLKKYFLKYLEYIGHPKSNLMTKAVCTRLEMSLRTEENCVDCNVFLMRHMETYLRSKNWNCGLKDEGPEQQTQIYELRKKYLSRILKSDINIKRSIVLEELEDYRNCQVALKKIS